MGTKYLCIGERSIKAASKRRSSNAGGLKRQGKGRGIKAAMCVLIGVCVCMCWLFAWLSRTQSLTEICLFVTGHTASQQAAVENNTLIIYIYILL